MSRERIIVDAGPLVAVLNRHDSQHVACERLVFKIPRPFLTTWPVITEAAWLLRNISGGVTGLLRMISEGLLDCYDLGSEASIWMEVFLKRYADQSPQLADASLMYLAEQEQIDTIFTLDRRDFLVFRRSGNRPLTLLPEL